MAKTAKNQTISGYELSRRFWNYFAEYPTELNPYLSHVYFWIIELFNRLSWPHEIGLPTANTMEMLGMKTYKRYKQTLAKLDDAGLISVTYWSKNQWQSNRIALDDLTKATSKHRPKHRPKQRQSTDQSTDDISKPLKTIETNKNLKTYINPVCEDFIFFSDNYLKKKKSGSESIERALSIWEKLSPKQQKLAAAGIDEYFNRDQTFFCVIDSYLRNEKYLEKQISDYSGSTDISEMDYGLTFDDIK